MIDSLCHLDLKLGTAHKAVTELYKQAKAAKVTTIFLCNLPGRQFDESEGFKNEAVLAELQQYDGFFKFFAGVDPDENTTFKNIEKLKEHGVSGIKLHPRLHKYNIETQYCIKTVKFAGELGLPVIICGFMDGLNLKLGNTPDAFGRLADKCPETKIVMAHAGGHKIVDSMMIMKSCPNLYLDISFTLLYYRACPRVMQDMKYVLESSRGKKILWGTDYPDRPYAKTIRLSMVELRKMKLSPEIKGKILEENSLELLD